MNDTAVVWIALGTPDEPTPTAVRRFLREFLMDPRIVEMNPAMWRVILELFVLSRRPRVSAEKYRSIWYDEGSPLLVHTQRQIVALKTSLTDAGVDAPIVYAMRYGEPSVASVLQGLADSGVKRVLIIPAYPQYSQTTVGSVYDAVTAYMRSSRNQMEYRFVRSWPTAPGYIEALASKIEEKWDICGRPDFDHGDTLLLSFHGIPVSMSEAGDPYRSECEATAQALRVRLGIDDTQCRVTFQSKFGPAPWLTPATINTVEALGKSGVARVDVICPAFTADCLETLEEIGILNREAFAEATNNKGEFHRIPCVNKDPAFIGEVTRIIQSNLQGWV
ncbi:MAG: ferrochelatase [Propionibacteriaceae bacterium]|jgi:ferrochelatase|nr:ferrochelatase [Propionibacteriaceae bacterium]